MLNKYYKIRFDKGKISESNNTQTSIINFFSFYAQNIKSPILVPWTWNLWQDVCCSNQSLITENNSDIVNKWWIWIFQAGLKIK